MRILQINSVANSGSTGRIAEDIGNVLLANGHESFIAYGRGKATSNSNLIKIGSDKNVLFHGAYTLLTDKHGFASRRATEKFVEEVVKINPDLIALHNLHGYYIHLPTLFNFISNNDIPVVWTLFDCWAFTGHCAYFDDIHCVKWKTYCNRCPKYTKYPSSCVDNSFLNFEEKKRIFTSVSKMEIIAHSKWLGDLVHESFLKEFKVHVTPSAINVDLFKPTISNLRIRYNLGAKKVILGCASTWSNRKGFNDFLSLSYKLDGEYQIVMIGLNTKEIKALPINIIGIQRTESIEELAQWYTLAYVFVNPTSQDNFPTTNIEALACGTPVITYKTGGSPESIDGQTGFVVEKGDVNGILEQIEKLKDLNYNDISRSCRERSENLYDKNHRFNDYLNIFKDLLYE